MSREKVQNQKKLEVGNVLMYGKDRFYIQSIDDKGFFELVQFKEKNVYEKMWQSFASKNEDPINAIIEWFYTARMIFSLTIPKKKNRERDYKQIKLLIEKDGFSVDDVVEILAFSMSNFFWKDNIISLAECRRVNKGSTKFQKVYDEYKKHLSYIEYGNIEKSRKNK